MPGVRAGVFLVGGIVAALLSAAGASAASLEQVGVFDEPLHVTSLPDPDRLLVAERDGRIVLSEDGEQRTFLDLAGAGLIQGSPGDRGLFSIALAPDFATSRHLYVFYSAAEDAPGSAGDGALQVDEFTVGPTGASLSSRRPVLSIEHPVQIHYGGQLQFGHDGYLYISTGDADALADSPENAQSLESPHGKVLRIDPRASATASYSIPPGNPFAGPDAALDEIWSLGLRSPWRFSFDRVTGDLLLADVGQESWEEIDFAPAPRAGRGLNFGWDCREGRHDFDDLQSAPCPSPSALTDPIAEYANSFQEGAAITGGYVVRDPALGNLWGRYLYADLPTSRVWSLIPAQPDALRVRREGSLDVDAPVSFGEDSCGRVYLASIVGPVYRLEGKPAGACPPPAKPPRCAGRAAELVSATRRFDGGRGADVVLGTPGRDRIRGGGGADRICGGGGADRISGGPGRDRCRGGGGRDRERGCESLSPRAR